MKIKEMMNKKVTMNKIKVPATKSDSMIELNYTSQRDDKISPDRKLEYDNTHLTLPAPSKMVKNKTVSPIKTRTVNVEDLKSPLPTNN